MTKTPADEAMEWLKETTSDWNMETCSQFDFDAVNTIRTALSLLSAVQGGKAKVLEREPTEAMVMRGWAAWNSANPFREGIQLQFQAMFDAAESYAAPSAAEVGK